MHFSIQAACSDPKDMKTSRIQSNVARWHYVMMYVLQLYESEEKLSECPYL